jgi:hypothetical protein
MVDRPPVKLLSALPEGSLNGFGVALPAALDDDFDRLYFIAEAVCPKTERNKETHIETAKLRICAVEVLVDGKMPDFPTASEALHGLRSERIGVDALLLEGSADEEYEHLADLRRQLAEYAAEQGMSETALGKDVIDTVPGAGAGWRDSPQILEEYLRTKGAIDDPPAGGAQ